MATSMRGITAMMLILSGCTVASGLSAGHATRPAASGGGPIAMTGTDTERTTVFEPPAHPGSLVREQLEALHGLSPDDARARLKQLGHVGKVTTGVVVSFDPKCGQNKVCGTSHDGGIDIHDDVELLLNPKLQISTPP